MKNKIIFEVITKGIKDKVLVSKKRRAKIKYWKNTIHIPTKYKNNDIYTTDFAVEEGFRVFNKKEESFVLANPISAGTPKYIPINTQRIYSGMPHFLRSKIVHEIKDWFKEFIRKSQIKPLDKSQYPFFAHLTIYKFNSKGYNKIPDIDNLSYIYMKCFMDVLKKDPENGGLGIIIDDSSEYYRGYCVDLRFTNEGNEHMVFRLINSTIL